MNKIFKAFTALTQIVRRPWLLNLVIDQEDNYKKSVVKKFGFPDGLPVIELTELFDGKFDTSIYPYAFLDGSCTPLDIALLKALAVKYKILNYLEIGTWRGESVANIAATAEKCTSVNLPDKEMAAMGMDKDYVGMHRFFSEGLANVTHIQANSATFDFSSLKENFDLVFIDGDHHSEMVASDSRKIFSIIDPENTIVVWHDYASNPEKIRWSVLDGILSGTPSSLHKSIVHVSHTLCAVYLPEKYLSGLKKRTFKANQSPGYAFDVRITARYL